MLALIHGAAGAIGLGLLLLALRGPRRGDAMGAGSFGLAAACLFTAALLLGLALPVVLKRASRLTGFGIATHASLAITAFVLFLAWASFD